MEKVADLAKLGDLVQEIEHLRTAGQTGLWIIAIVMIAVLVLLITAVTFQRLAISRHEQLLKSVETNIKSTETYVKSVETNIKSVETALKERELGVKERDELRSIFAQQFSLVKDANAELRTEMSRLRDQQTGLKDSINHTITEGLKDIRERIANTSVQEIVSQIPETFRQELSVEFESALRVSSEKLRLQIESTDFKDRIDTALSDITKKFDERLFNKLEGRLQSALRSRLR
jgi:septal ring factor EnvC (AmiA/AmiB activator)